MSGLPKPKVIRCKPVTAQEFSAWMADKHPEAVITVSHVSLDRRPLVTGDKLRGGILAVMVEVGCNNDRLLDYWGEFWGIIKDKEATEAKEAENARAIGSDLTGL